MRQLVPPLNVIESNLFDPSLALIQRWIDGDDSQSAAQRDALSADPRACAMADALRAPASQDLDIADDEPPTLPRYLVDLIENRVQTAARGLDLTPRPGLMLRLDRALAPSGPTGWDMGQPLAVLLSEPTEHPEIWYGYLMSAETDYAGRWDLLLEDQDAPFDPLAAMVQVWNPVHVYTPSASAALGELSPPRLAAVRGLALDLFDEALRDAHAQDIALDSSPGTLIQRATSAGQLVLTGTPLGDESDPRRRYRTLYFAAADLVRDLARQAVQELSPTPSWGQRLLDGLRTAAREWQLVLEPIPMPAMGRVAEPPETSALWRLGDWLDVRLIPSHSGEAVQIHAVRRASEPLVVELAAAGQVRQRQRLDEGRPEADLFVGAGEGLTLRVRAADDRVVFEAPFPDALPDIVVGSEAPPHDGA